ncbi:MAG: AAA family ATPase [Phycisphaerae bacterium]|nr:AAA family ATPase [Phycisphaerae bacterium]
MALDQDNLFGRSLRRGVRVVVTGQVGVDKRPFLERVVEIAEENGRTVELANVGDRMYAEAPDVVHGRILDLPLGRLNSLRRSVFKDILSEALRGTNLLVNTHATFRWKHGLFPAFDHDQLQALAADLYVTLVDNVDALYERLEREHDVHHRLKDLLVWREEEILATEIMATTLRGHGCFYVVSRGYDDTTPLMLYRLMFEPERKKVYPSFPMTHVMDMPDILAELEAFRGILADHFVTFDPGDVDEKRLLIEAGEANRRGERFLDVEVHGRSLSFSTDELMAVAGDIDGQIYARDFKLIDQSDMIISYIPEMPDGRPGLSSGVERELQHAHEATKEVYVIWRPRREPSPFVTETATRVFPTIKEALDYFQKRGDIGDYQLRLPRETSTDAEPKSTLF